MEDKNIERKCSDVYERLTKTLMEQKLEIAVMESCTSGCIASLITDTEGASAVMKGSLVTYSNWAKVKCGVPSVLIEKYGVYSRETAGAMAITVREYFESDIAAGVTGSLGRADPANEDSVPGQVYFAVDYLGEVHLFYMGDVFGRDRHESKLIIAKRVAEEILNILKATEQKRPLQ